MYRSYSVMRWHFAYVIFLPRTHSPTLIMSKNIRPILGTSLMVQLLRICLPVQGTGVRALVWKDPTCRGATKPVRHNY